jgi:hypothetical protein
MCQWVEIAQWLMHYATSQKAKSSRTDEMSELFQFN